MLGMYKLKINLVVNLEIRFYFRKIYKINVEVID
jgi:hypothetical protein